MDKANNKLFEEDYIEKPQRWLKIDLNAIPSMIQWQQSLQNYLLDKSLKKLNNSLTPTPVPPYGL